jgi:NADH:ubiquinone oxidoreductase subunit 3 (subunit A)
MKDVLIVSFGAGLFFSIIFAIIVGGADFMWDFQIDHIDVIRTGSFLMFVIMFIYAFLYEVKNKTEEEEKQK